MRPSATGLRDTGTVRRELLFLAREGAGRQLRRVRQEWPPRVKEGAATESCRAQLALVVTL